MPLTFRSSSTITDLVFANELESWCRESFRRAGDLVVQPLSTQPRLLTVRGTSLLTRQLAIKATKPGEALAQRPPRLDHEGRVTIVDNGSRPQAEIDADDVPRLGDRLRLDNLSLPLDGERDEPTVGPPPDRRRQDPAVNAPMCAGFLETNPADHRQPTMALLEIDLVQPGRVTLALALETW
jgi:hypothetical protein